MSANEDSELAKRNAQLERELTAMVERINDALVMAMDLSDKLEEMRVRNAELQNSNRDDLRAYYNSMVYRTGISIMGAFRRLGLPLPYRLVRRSYRLVRGSYRIVMLPYRLVRRLLELPVVSRRRDTSQD